MKQADSEFTIQFDRLVQYRGSDPEVMIPDGVTVIGKKAFYAKPVRTVDLPESVTEIEAEAFGLTRLETIKIAGKIRKVGKMAFPHNDSLNVCIYRKIPIGSFCKSDQIFALNYFFRTADEKSYDADVWLQNLKYTGRNIMHAFSYHRLICDELSEHRELFRAVMQKGKISAANADALLVYYGEVGNTELVAEILEYRLHQH